MKNEHDLDLVFLIVLLAAILLCCTIYLGL